MVGDHSSRRVIHRLCSAARRLLRGGRDEDVPGTRLPDGIAGIQSRRELSRAPVAKRYTRAT